MIEYIKGDIVELTPTQMIIECAGIGYQLNISLTTYSAFNGKPSGKIYVYEVIREDAHLLFGFALKAERELFFAVDFGIRSRPQYGTHDLVVTSPFRTYTGDSYQKRNRTHLCKRYRTKNSPTHPGRPEKQGKGRRYGSWRHSSSGTRPRSSCRRSSCRPGYVGIPKDSFTEGSKLDTEKFAYAGCGTSD